MKRGISPSSEHLRSAYRSDAQCASCNASLDRISLQCTARTPSVYRRKTPAYRPGTQGVNAALNAYNTVFTKTPVLRHGTHGVRRAHAFRPGTHGVRRSHALRSGLNGASLVVTLAFLPRCTPERNAPSFTLQCRSA